MIADIDQIRAQRELTAGRNYSYTDFRVCWFIEQMIAVVPGIVWNEQRSCALVVDRRALERYMVEWVLAATASQLTEVWPPITGIT